MCQIWLANVKAKKLRAEHENISKPFKFDLEVIGQRRIGIMNVRDTLSHGNFLLIPRLSLHFLN